MFAIRRISVTLLVVAWLLGAMPSRSYAETFDPNLFGQSSNQAFNSRNFQFFAQLNQIFRKFRDIQGFSTLAQDGNQLFVKDKTTGLPALKLLLTGRGILAQSVNSIGQAFGNFFRAPREPAHQALEFFAKNQQKLGNAAKAAFNLAAVNELGSGRQFANLTIDCNAGVTPKSKVNAGDEVSSSFQKLSLKEVCAKTINYMIAMTSNPLVGGGPKLTANDIGPDGRVTINLLNFYRPEHVALIKADNYRTCEGRNPSAPVSVGDMSQILGNAGNYNILGEVDPNDATETYRRYGVNLNFPRRFLGPNNPFARLTNSALLTQQQTTGSAKVAVGDTKEEKITTDGSNVSTGTARLIQRFVKNFGTPFYLTTDQKSGISGSGQVGSSIGSNSGIAGFQGVAEEGYAVLKTFMPRFLLATTPQNDGKRVPQTAAPAEIAATGHKDPRLRSIQNGFVCLYCHNNLTAANNPEKAGNYKTNLVGGGLSRDGINGVIKAENPDRDNFFRGLNNQNAMITKPSGKSSEPLAFDALEKQIQAFDLKWADREMRVPAGTMERLVKQDPNKWKAVFGIAADQPITDQSLIRRENWIGGGFCKAQAALASSIRSGGNNLLAQRNGAGARATGGGANATGLGRLVTDSPTHANGI